MVPRILQQAKLEMVSNSRLKKAVKDLNLEGNRAFFWYLSTLLESTLFMEPQLNGYDWFLAPVTHLLPDPQFERDLTVCRICCLDFSVPMALMSLVYMLPDIRTKPDSDRVIFFTEVSKVLTINIGYQWSSSACFIGNKGYFQIKHTFELWPLINLLGKIRDQYTRFLIGTRFAKPNQQNVLHGPNIGASLRSALLSREANLLRDREGVW